MFLARRGNQLLKDGLYISACERIRWDVMFQLLNKEHEKAEDSKPVAIPATS